MNISKRNDILYGQNWVEQMRETRRVLELVCIFESSFDTPFGITYNVSRLTELTLWERRSHSFRLDERNNYLICCLKR